MTGIIRKAGIMVDNWKLRRAGRTDRLEPEDVPDLSLLTAQERETLALGRVPSTFSNIGPKT